MKCSREGDIDVVSIVHQNLLDSAFLDHRVDNQRVHDGVIKLKPLIDSTERDGVLRPPIWRRGTVGRHQDLSLVSFCCLLLSQDPWSPKMTLTSQLMRGKALPPPKAEAILVRLPLFVVGAAAAVGMIGRCRLSSLSPCNYIGCGASPCGIGTGRPGSRLASKRCLEPCCGARLMGALQHALHLLASSPSTCPTAGFPPYFASRVQASCGQ